MMDFPVSLILDLWSLGHSGADIVKKLGIANRRVVERLVDQARSIGDPRAVYHVAASGRIMGTGIPRRKRYRVRRQTHYEGFQLVEMIGKPVCDRGHMRLPHNVDEWGHCKQCHRENLRAFAESRP
jgi:hypothetical protein